MRSYSNFSAADDIRELHPGYIYAYICLCSCIALFGLVGNVLLYYVIIRVRSLHTPTNLLLLSLTTADLLVCGVMIPMYLERFYNSAVHGGSNEVICLARKFLFMLTSACSLTSLAMVSVDRMLAICYPFRYSPNVVRSKVVLAILFIWMWSGGFCCASFYRFYSWTEILRSCSAGIPRTLFFIVTPPCFYLPGLVIILSYWKIFLVARRHQRKISDQGPVVLTYDNHSMSFTSIVQASTVDTADLLSSPGKLGRRDRARARTVSSVLTFSTNAIRDLGHDLTVNLKAAKTISILVGTMVLSWGPIAIFYIYLSLPGVAVKGNDVLDYLHDWFMLFTFMSSAINPLLYSLLNACIRKAARKVLLRGSQHHIPA